MSFLPTPGCFRASWELLSSLDTLDRRSIVNTYREMIASPSIYERSPEIQKIQNEFSAEFDVSVTVVPDTSILRLTVEGCPDRAWWWWWQRPSAVMCWRTSTS